jgi:lipid-binding SYLF domain-containing protein
MIRVATFAAALIFAMLIVGPVVPRPATAADAASINRDANAAMKTLYANSAVAKELGAKAKGILVFPNILKAGFMFGGQIGEGVLRKRGKLAGYYNSVAVSYGFQAGAQVFGYALFFMSEDALKYLDKSEGWEIGAGPSVVVVDAGMGKSMTSTTLKDDVYAFIFDQKGLMGGLGVQGTKITPVSK